MPGLEVMRPGVPLYMGLSLSLSLHGPRADWSSVLEVGLHLITVSDFGFRVWALGFGFRVSGFGFRVWGLRVWVDGLGSRD